MESSAPDSRSHLPGFRDGLGERHTVAQRSGGELEYLQFRQTLAAEPFFAPALKSRVARLSRFTHASYCRVRRVQHASGGDGQIAEDAVQSAWSIAWRKLGSLRDPTRLKPWLLTVTANEARQIVRRQRRHPVVAIDMATSSPAGPDPSSAVDALDLRRALAHLDPDDRTLLALRYVAGLDSAEIASLTKKSASGVRSRLAVLLAHLREELSRA